ncbi:MAG: ABC transporter ATP-binding protein [Alphaproteobacteria bacterium]
MIDLIGVGNGDTLSSIDLSIEDGVPTVLLGPTGAGKTALLRILDPPHHGQVNRGDVAPIIAFVQAEAFNYPNLSVLENIAAPLEQLRLDTAEIERKVRAMARRMALGQHLDSHPGQLNLEQQQRLAMARARVKDPDILLLDDILASLNPDQRNRLRKELVTIFAERRGATVYATSNPREAMVLAARTAVLDNGGIVQTAKFKAIHHAPATLNVGEFIGNPPKNVFHGRIDGSDVRFESGVHFALPEHFSDLTNGPYCFAVRANHLTLSGRLSGDVRLPATIEIAEDNGVDTTLHLRHGDTPLVALLRGIGTVESGAVVEVYLDPSRLIAFHADGALVAAPEDH